MMAVHPLQVAPDRAEACWKDISVTLRENMPVFPGEPAPQLEPIKRIAEGANSNVTAISMGLHAGTHVDAPWHFLQGGRTVEQLSLESLCGPAHVIAVNSPHHIGVPELEQAWPTDTDRVLFKTRNSGLWAGERFREDYVYLTDAAAEWIVRRKVRLVGVDYLSIECFGLKEAPVHKTLLSMDVVIVEGLDLRGVEPGLYDFLCLPLKIEGAEAAPARALLRRREEL